MFFLKRLSGIVFLALVLLLPAGSRGAETDFFDRHELFIDGPIEDILIGDADADGLEDIFVFYRQETNTGDQYRVAFFRQDSRDHFKNTIKQSWGLPESGGFIDLADVVGNHLRELVVLNRQGIHYYPLQGTSYDPIIKTLFPLAVLPDVPPRALRTWDFCWPLVAGTGEVVSLPRIDCLELWIPDSAGTYLPADSLLCQTIVNSSGTRSYRPENFAGGLTGIAYCLPAPAQPVSPAAGEIFLSSTAGVKGFRRNDLTQLDFNEGAVMISDNSAAPFFSRGPFGSGVKIEDLNGDGSSDLIRWQAHGGITEARTDLDVFYGPLTERRPSTPNQSIALDNITAYPLFADLDGDKRKEIVLCAVELGTIAAAKMIVVKNANLYLLAYRQQPDNSFGKDPDARLKVNCRLDTDSPELLSRVPVRFVDDLNADGLADFVVCPGEDEFHVYLGQEGRLLPEDETLTIDCDAPAAVYSVDLNHDRKTDLAVLHHTKPYHVHKVTVFLAR